MGMVVMDQASDRSTPALQASQTHLSAWTAIDTLDCMKSRVSTSFALALAACGGGGSSSPIAVVPGPTPTPTPSPIATPTPSPSYDMAFDLSRDRSFEAIGAELRSFSTTSPATNSVIETTLQEDVAGVLITYTATTKQAKLSIGRGAEDVYDGSNITLNEDDRLVYVRPDGFFNFAQPGPRIGSFPTRLNYVALVRQSKATGATRDTVLGFDRIERSYVIGSATVPSDVPVTGTASYEALLSAYGETPDAANGYTQQNAALSMDFDGRTLNGTITAASTVSNAPSSTLTFVLNGQVNATTGRVVGSITSPDGATGTFSGRLYGPKGVELGLAFTVSRGSERVIGTLVARRR